MLRWFRRHDPDDEFEEDEEIALPASIDFGDANDAPVEVRPPPEVPDFAVIVAAAAANGWHMAAVVTDTRSPDFYVRALTVRWPFMLARPVPSNRVSDKRVSPHLLSPTGSRPATKLVVNWDWTLLEESFAQLRFYVRRRPTRWLGDSGRLKLRLTLKESGGERRRIVLPVKSNSVSWNRVAAAEAATPAQPPAPAEQAGGSS